MLPSDYSSTDTWNYSGTSIGRDTRTDSSTSSWRDTRTDSRHAGSDASTDSDTGCYSGTNTRVDCLARCQPCLSRVW